MVGLDIRRYINSREKYIGGLRLRLFINIRLRNINI